MILEMIVVSIGSIFLSKYYPCYKDKVGQLHWGWAKNE